MKNFWRKIIQALIKEPEVVKARDKQYALTVFEIERDEGRRALMYLDSEGIPTIGVGFNLKANPLPSHMIDELRDLSIGRAEKDCIAIYSQFSTLSSVRQRALINMAFNLGRSRLRKFKKMWAAIDDRDWDLAAVEALDSKWAGQVGKRANRIARQLREG